MRLRTIKRRQSRKANLRARVPAELRTHTRYSRSKSMPHVGSPQSRFEADQRTMRRCAICGKAHRDCACAQIMEGLWAQSMCT